MYTGRVAEISGYVTDHFLSHDRMHRGSSAVIKINLTHGVNKLLSYIEIILFPIKKPSPFKEEGSSGCQQSGPVSPLI